MRAANELLSLSIQHNQVICESFDEANTKIEGGPEMQSEALVKAATKASLPEPGKVKEFMADGKTVCIANLNGEIYAADNVCPHWGGPQCFTVYRSSSAHQIGR